MTMLDSVPLFYHPLSCHWISPLFLEVEMKQNTGPNFWYKSTACTYLWNDYYILRSSKVFKIQRSRSIRKAALSSELLISRAVVFPINFLPPFLKKTPPSPNMALKSLGKYNVHLILVSEASQLVHVEQEGIGPCGLSDCELLYLWHNSMQQYR